MFIINGKEKKYNCPKILVWSPMTSSDVIVKAESLNEENFCSYPNFTEETHSLNCHDYTDEELVFEKSQKKKKVNPKFRVEKNSILKTNARRKEKRIANFPNRRHISHLAAAQIWAAI